MRKEKILLIVDRVQEFSLYVLLFYIPISNAIIESLFGVAFLCFIIKKALQPDFSFLKSKITFALLLFVIFNFLSLINSGPYLIKGLKAIFLKWLEYIGIFILVSDSFSNRKRMRNAVIILFLSSFLVGIDGICQKFFQLEFLRGKPILEVKDGIYAITASFNHYNGLGAYLIIPLSLAVSMFFVSGIKNKYRIITFFLAGVLLACLSFTFSRGSWIGFISSLALMTLLTKRFKLIGGIFLVFSAFLLSDPALRARILFTFSPYGDADRFLVWGTAFRMIRENPFLGKGIGTFMDYFHAYTPQLFVQYAHNCFLQIWAETGIFSLLSFLSFIYLLLSGAIKVFKGNNKFVLLGLTCGIFGYLAHSFFDTQLYSLQLAVFFWYMAGLTYSLFIRKIDVFS